MSGRRRHRGIRSVGSIYGRSGYGTITKNAQEVDSHFMQTLKIVAVLWSTSELLNCSVLLPTRFVSRGYVKRDVPYSRRMHDGVLGE
jgi:hypothetical protein